MIYLTTRQLIARDGKGLTVEQQSNLITLLLANGTDMHDTSHHLEDVMMRRLYVYDAIVNPIYWIVKDNRTSEPSGEPSQDPWERIAQIAGELQASTQALITALQAQTSKE